MQNKQTNKQKQKTHSGMNFYLVFQANDTEDKKKEEKVRYFPIGTRESHTLP